MLLISATGLLLIAGFILVAFLITSRPVFSRGPVLGAPVRWSSLPVPVVAQPQWKTYSYAGPINDLAFTGNLLWAGTDGGLAVWDLPAPSAPPVKFTVEHGLAANRVKSLVVGRDGVIWVGTVNGLSRYDGTSWQTFTTADGLPADKIQDLAVDREGYLWVATPAGLARYDGRDWRVFSDRGVLASLPQGNITSLAIDSLNRLWVGTDRGLARYDGRWTVFTEDTGLPAEPVQKIVAAPSGEIWITTPMGFKRFDGQAWNSFTPALPGNNNPVLEPVAFVQANDGTLLISMSNDSGKLLRFDPVTGQTQLASDLWPDELPGAVVSAMLVDERGNVWVGEGDSAYQLGSGSVTKLTSPSELPSPEVNSLLNAGSDIWLTTGSGASQFDGSWRAYGVSEGLSEGHPTQLAVDESGTMWAAFEFPLAGLSRFDPATGDWQTITCPVDAPSGLSINQIMRRPYGVLWFATENGVSRYDGEVWESFTTRDGLPAGPVGALVSTKNGMVWVGTAAGLARLNEDRWQMIDSLPVDGLAGTGNEVWVLSEGRLYQVSGNQLVPALDPPLTSAIRGVAATPGSVWLATTDGVFRYDGSSWSIYTTADGLPSLDVTAITAAGDSVWAATSSDAQQIDLVYFDGEAWRPHPNRDVAAEQLLSSVVRDVLRTPDSAMWLTTTAGINRYHEGQWTAYTSENGLPGNDVRQLVWTFDTLWAATDLGLARFNGRTWEAFGGVAHDQPGAGVHSLAVGPDGELYVALDEGWPNALRLFDGRGWSIIPLRSSATTIRQLAVDPAGRLIALVTDFGRSYLGTYDGQNWVWQDEAQWPLAIDQMAVDPLGRLWVVGRTRTAGASVPAIAVFELSERGIAQELGRFTGPDPEGFVSGDFLPGDGGNPFLFSDDGRVLLGGAGAIYVLGVDKAGNLVLSDTLAFDLPFTRHTFALEFADSGELWAATERGVAILNNLAGSSTSSQVRSFYAPAKSPAWWGSVRSINVRPDGGILLGTAAGGVGIYTGREFDGVLHPSQGPRAWARSFFPINAVLPEESDRLWVGSAGGGAARFSGSLWEVVAPDPALLAPVTGLALAGGSGWIGTEAGLVAVSGLSTSECRIEHIEPGLQVTEAVRDAAGGLWAGTAGNGVLYLPGPEDGSLRQELGKAPVPALAVAPNGELWFANGHQPWLTRYRPGDVPDNESAWNRLPLNLGQISPQSITALAVAPNLDIWIGSDEGLVRFSGGNWTRLTTREGLPDNNIRDLLITPGGDVWVSTPGGVSRFSP